MRLNLGSGKYPLEGWTNVDAHCEADVQGDIRDLHFHDVEAVNMDHLLEHFSWRETTSILARIHSWMLPGGDLRIEVPDMTQIMERGTQHPRWFKYVYGDQSTPGEFHLAGFTCGMLVERLQMAGFRLRFIAKNTSRHQGRRGMPCLVARASA